MRVIVRIDIKNDFVIKGINLEGLRKIGDPKTIIKKYYNSGIDEIIIIDSVASLYGRNNLFNFIKEITKEVFVPITLGGGIRNFKDIENALNSGADKVAINSKALEEPNFIKEASNRFGSSTIISYIEAKKRDQNNWEPYKFCGRERSFINLKDWIKTIQDSNCGEILLTSIDQEGTQKGLDLNLFKEVNNLIHIPIILSGGCGSLEDIEEFNSLYPSEALAIASALHYSILEISQIKKSINEKNNNS